MACVFAGTFDPVTKGHLNIIRRAEKKFGFVYVVLGVNDKKTPLFSEEQRLEILNAVFGNEKNIKVIMFSKSKESYAEFLKNNGVSFYVRGIRNEDDYKYEKAFEEKNGKEYPFIKTVYIKADKRFDKISSTFVKEVIESGKDFGKYVPEKARKKIAEFLEK